MNIERAYTMEHETVRIAEAAAFSYLRTREVADLENLIDFLRIPEMENELILWQAQRALHDRTGRWARDTSQGEV